MINNTKHYKSTRSSPNHNQKCKSPKRNFEGLYIHSSERLVNENVNDLYQGGTPVGEFRDQYKALPLSVAKINFKTDVKEVNFNNEYFTENFPTYYNTVAYEMPTSRYS
jgi:hypothetical protein